MESSAERSRRVSRKSRISVLLTASLLLGMATFGGGYYLSSLQQLLRSGEFRVLRFDALKQRELVTPPLNIRQTVAETKNRNNPQMLPSLLLRFVTIDHGGWVRVESQQSLGDDFLKQLSEEKVNAAAEGIPCAWAVRFLSYAESQQDLDAIRNKLIADAAVPSLLQQKIGHWPDILAKAGILMPVATTAFVVISYSIQKRRRIAVVSVSVSMRIAKGIKKQLIRVASIFESVVAEARANERGVAPSQGDTSVPEIKRDRSKSE